MNSTPETTTGTVFLVGAGPGDPGLLTLKGKTCIETADVIYYDALVNPVLLDHARPDAVRVYVGKKAGSHAFTQARINAMLAASAQEGLSVCRLKGGDPFLFGRGGEEAAYLRQRNIPVIMVPGVSAALAVPAYAGIPVTHRDYSSAVHVISGHEAMGEAAAAMAQLMAQSSRHTLVVLMGHRNLREVVAHLLKNGLPGDTPTACIAQGTETAQRVLTAPAGIIASLAEQANLPTPALLIVGAVVQLRECLAWFPEQALKISLSSPA